MAGYICKIVIEDTHPPVWRRVVIPDKITFFELHQIIQTVFQWEDVHLHDFRIPSDDIVINDEGEDGQGYNYGEFDTTIDYFFENYKWIRYTYDFGDDWRHRINIEKYDPEYKERCPKLLKYKGDNFMEDSGGMWLEEMEDSFHVLEMTQHPADFLQILYQMDNSCLPFLPTTFHRYLP